jgi:hypothetical protein
MINGKIVRALDVGYGKVKYLKIDCLNYYIQNHVLSLISEHNFFI